MERGGGAKDSSSVEGISMAFCFYRCRILSRIFGRRLC